MASLAALSALVVSDHTRRPELSAVTAAAVRSAVLRAHHVDFFPRDLNSVFLSYTPTNTALYYDVANIYSVADRLRSIKSLLGTDAVTSAPVEIFEGRAIDDVYDSEAVRRQSIYVLLGDALRIYPQRPTGAAQLTFYRNPAIVGDLVSSWIADTYPDQIAAWAAAAVYARTGFAEQARMLQETAINPFKDMLLASHLLAETR